MKPSFWAVFQYFMSPKIMVYSSCEASEILMKMNFTKEQKIL